MAYSDFKLEEALEKFELSQESRSLFESVQPIQMSDWLHQSLEVGKKLALFSSTEKARSEFIVVPVLIELERRHPGECAIYSGKRFDVDKQRGLVGECDFLMARGPMKHVVEAPVLSLVEAKKQDLELGLGQCTAQMVGASVFNQKHGKEPPAIYGCVTTGENWLFLLLEGTRLTIDERVYYYNELEIVLGIFETIFQRIKPNLF